MKKRPIKEILFGIVIIICLVLIIAELKNNLFGKENQRNAGSVEFQEYDSVENDSLIPYELEWDSGTPDYLRQEY